VSVRTADGQDEPAAAWERCFVAWIPGSGVRNAPSRFTVCNRLMRRFSGSSRLISGACRLVASAGKRIYRACSHFIVGGKSGLGTSLSWVAMSARSAPTRLWKSASIAAARS
jgi:hypothetical protein